MLTEAHMDAVFVAIAVCNLEVAAVLSGRLPAADSIAVATGMQLAFLPAVCLQKERRQDIHAFVYWLRWPNAAVFYLSDGFL